MQNVNKEVKIGEWGTVTKITTTDEWNNTFWEIKGESNAVWLYQECHCGHCDSSNLSYPTEEEIRMATKGYCLDEVWQKCNDCNNIFIVS